MVLSPLVLVLRGLGIGIGIEGQNFDSIGIGIGIEGPSIDFWYWYWYWYCNPCCHRNGKFNNSKRRSIIATFSSIWDARRMVSKSIERKLFQEKGILVLAQLSPSDQEIERSLLAKRCNLINDGTDKSRITIPNLKLYIEGKEIAHNDNWLVQPLKRDILLYKVRSLCSFEKQVKLANRLALLDADAACLTETWLNSSIGDSNIFSSSYSTSAMVDRVTGEHGGCLILTKNTIYIDQIDSTVDFGCATKIHTCSQDLLLICIYNPPFSSKFRSAAIDIINFLSQVIYQNSDLPTVICGDFNMPDVNWDTYHSHSTNSVQIVNFRINHGFEQLVTLPTHINGNTLDLIFVIFSTCRVSEVGTGITDISDHFLISFQRYFDNKKTHLSNCNHKVHIPPKFYSYLQLELASSLFSVLSPITSENYAIDWLENFAQLLSLHNRKKRQKHQNAPFYYSSHIMHLLNVLNTSKRLCQKYPSALNLSKMNAIARDVNISIELDTAVFVDSFTKRNSGLNGCFKLQNLLRTSNVPNVMIHNDVKLQQNVDIAEAFNAFFASVFNHKTSAFSDFSDNEVNTVQITQTDVSDALYLSTPGKGHDGISGDFLKTCCSQFSFHVYKLFQSILHSGIYPEEWKIAKITPYSKPVKSRM